MSVSKNLMKVMEDETHKRLIKKHAKNFSNIWKYGPNKKIRIVMRKMRDNASGKNNPN